ncbi:MAG: hypothetical protein K8R53_06575 [Bacteroidales bacterium]|nr:hypothetical protein [Bacteroidales bacterium]
MKKILLSIPAFFIAIFLIGQQVPRDKVIVEIVTGTWCYYCPGAAMGADDLVANGHDVAIIEYHNGDPFANTASNARKTYYGISGIPAAKFDGVLTVSGGNHSTSMYGAYLPKYNARIVIPSSFELEIFGEHTGLDYNITVVASKVASTTSSNMVLQLALTESHIPYSWQGQSILNFVERLMAPSHTGTPVTFANGDIEMIDLDFTVNASWVLGNCELVAFIQDNTSKEILQGTKIALVDLEPHMMNNVAAEAIDNILHTNCSGKVEPDFYFTNMGFEALTSLENKYNVNGGTEHKYNWNG